MARAPGAPKDGWRKPELIAESRDCCEPHSGRRTRRAPQLTAASGDPRPAPLSLDRLDAALRFKRKYTPGCPHYGSPMEVRVWTYTAFRRRDAGLETTTAKPEGCAVAAGYPGVCARSGASASSKADTSDSTCAVMPATCVMSAARHCFSISPHRRDTRCAPSVALAPRNL